MRFTKMQGIGNDYVYVDCIAQRVEDRPALARRLSNRNFGVGADGLICICPSAVADFKMDMYNADGSQGQMCGNGIRCVGKYVYERGLTDKTRLTVETGAGLRTLDLNISNGTVRSVRVDMGSPELRPERIPVLARGEAFLQQPIEVQGKIWTVTAVSIGNPHAVTFVEDVDALDLAAIGPAFEHHPLFPERVNTEFVQVLDQNTLKMRVWERGSGETLACGTGATATLVAAALCGYAADHATVMLLGGNLEIAWDRTNNQLYMTGPAEFVFDGELC
jgi:diaminopimelate epimerase